MTGPRSATVQPHRTRARPLLPFLAAIMLSSLACSEQPAVTEPSNDGVVASTRRLHPYRMGTAAARTSTSFYRSSALVSLGTASTTGGRVLLLADENGASTTALANSIADAGFLVTIRPAPEFTWDGTNPSPEGYDLIIHLNGNTIEVGQMLSPAAQGALVDFVRAGGGFIGSQWNSYEVWDIQETTGQPAAMQDLVLAGFPGSPEENCPSCSINYVAVPEQLGHPLLAGIPSDFTFEADGHSGGPQVQFGTDPSTVIMALPSGTPGVLVRNLGQGKVVNFSFAPNYSLAGDGHTLQDLTIQQLYVNAVRWAARTGTQPTKLPATITLVDPASTFDGTTKAVSVTTNPAGLTGLSVTYSQDGVAVPAPVNAGTYQVVATLTHEDYEAPQASGTLTIQRATPTIHWASPVTILVGTALGSDQLNASVTGVGGIAPAGELVYLPASGTIMDQAGSRPLSVEFVSWDDNYSNVIGQVFIVVSQPASGLTFRGFYMPVRNLPVRNVMKAGRSVVVKFSVSGVQRAAALQGLPVSRNVPCLAGVAERTIENTGDSRRSHLEVQRQRGEYRYTWKTSSEWAGTCRAFEVKLIDGSKHEAVFHFPRSKRPRAARPNNHRGDRDDD